MYFSKLKFNYEFSFFFFSSIWSYSPPSLLSLKIKIKIKRSTQHSLSFFFFFFFWAKSFIFNKRQSVTFDNNQSLAYIHIFVYGQPYCLIINKSLQTPLNERLPFFVHAHHISPLWFLTHLDFWLTLEWGSISRNYIFFFLLVIFGSRPAKNWEEEIYVDFVIEFPYENSFNFLSLVSEFKLKVGV